MMTAMIMMEAHATVHTQSAVVVDSSSSSVDREVESSLQQQQRQQEQQQQNELHDNFRSNRHRILHMMEGLMEHVVSQMLVVSHNVVCENEKESNHNARILQVKRECILNNTDAAPSALKSFKRKKYVNQISIHYQPPDANSVVDEFGERHVNPLALYDNNNDNDKDIGSTTHASGSAASLATSSYSLHASNRWNAPSSTSSKKRKRTASQSQSSSQDEESEILNLRQNQNQNQTADEEASLISPPSHVYTRNEDDETCQRQEGTSMLTDLSSLPIKSRSLNFPSHNSLRFVRLLHILADSYGFVQDSIHVNQREFHYHDKSLFPKQAQSDDILSLLCSIIQVQRSELNILISPKGNVHGALQYEVEMIADQEQASNTPQIEIVNCLHGCRITPFVDRVRGMVHDVDWVLIVEKDTVWRKIAQSGFDELQRCLLVTDGGMPSLSTRQFLRLFHEQFPAVPMYALVDADPDGLNIYKNYKFGTCKTVLERACLPSLQYLGASIRDVEALGLLERSDVVLPLKPREITMCHNLSNSIEATVDDIIREESEALLRCGVKAEIEGLYKVDAHYFSETYILEKKKRVDQKRMQIQEQTQ